MSNESDNATRLGDLVASRRIALGYATQEHLATVTGLHTRTINGIENARRSASRSTRAVLEKALQWEPGSIRAILDGGDPTPTESREVSSPGSFDDYPDWLDAREREVWDKLRIYLYPKETERIIRYARFEREQQHNQGAA